MKQLVLTIVLSVAAISSYARSSDDRSLLSRITEFTNQNTTYDLCGNNLVFHGLSRNNTELYIMDSKGNVEASAVLTRKNNVISISQLPQGNHVLALKSGSKIKMCGYCSEIFITAPAKKKVATHTKHIYSAAATTSVKRA